MKSKFGIYIHVPFCRSKCNYCNFYSVANQSLTEKYTTALENEILSRNNEEKGEVSSIYLGGGTPSLMNEKWFTRIFDLLFSNYNIITDAEITIECNPDDITIDFLNSIKRHINRLSIGTQSFNDEILAFLSRKHLAQKGIDSIKLAQDFGFENITADLIYGVPNGCLEIFENDVQQFLDLKIPHLSAYSLTVEEKTKLSIEISKGIKTETSDNDAETQYLWLMKKMREEGFHHYEISNYARPNYESKHNSSYWIRQAYLGFGPSAHSFSINKRRWNIASVAQYIQKIQTKEIYYEEESLSEIDKLNEYIMTGLRTSVGISIDEIASKCDQKMMTIFNKNLKQIDSKLYSISDNNMILNDKGKLFADGIAASLFFG
jgi:oxygen-independent coproporphyrinogen-3 oxidase